MITVRLASMQKRRRSTAKRTADTTGYGADQQRLPRWRLALRNALLPLIRAETPLLAALQSRLRTPFLDAYFASTANLGTHTFFMTILPLLFWGGYSTLARE